MQAVPMHTGVRLSLTLGNGGHQVVLQTSSPASAQPLSPTLLSGEGQSTPLPFALCVLIKYSSQLLLACKEQLQSTGSTPHPLRKTGIPSSDFGAH